MADNRRMRLGRLTAAGIAAALVFTFGGVVAGGAFSSTADVARGTLSDLGAATADDAWVWNSAATAAGVLVVAVAVGLYPRLRGLPGATAAAVLIALFGMTLAAAFPFRRDCRTTEPGCGAGDAHSWHHVGHELVSPFGSLGLMVALVLLTRAFGADPALEPLRRFSGATVVGFVALLAAYLSVEGRPGAGVLERLSALLVFTWLAVVAYRLDRAPRRDLRSSGRRPRRGPRPPTPRARAARPR